MQDGVPCTTVVAPPLNNTTSTVTSTETSSPVAPATTSSSVTQSTSSSLTSTTPPKSATDLPLISVIIPYKRYERLSLRQAIDSATTQTYPNVEVIVVGGNSTSTQELIAAYSENARVSIFEARQPNKTFAGYTRNLAIYNHSSPDSQYLAFLDADDAWLPQKLELQYKFAQLYGVEAFSYTESLASRTCRYDRKTSVFTPWNMSNFNNPHDLKSKGGGGVRMPLYNGKEYDSTLQRKFGTAGSKLPVTFDLDMLKKHNFVITSTVLMSRALFEAAGGFDAKIKGKEDHDLWKRALYTASFPENTFHPYAGYLNIPLAIYDWRCHGQDGTDPTNTKH